ncbi:MAG: HTTM domain-containing protein [Bacteroidota bacterium]
MWNKWLFKQVDNTSLVVFRIIFGLLITLEAWGAIATGWVRRVLVEPDFTFHFIGFDFLQPLPGNGMYFYFAFMGLLGVFVMLGYKYKWSISGYAIMWTAVYLMQKSSYNNHYYLLILLCIFMVLAPAHRYFSLDAKFKPAIKKIAMPRWVWLFIVLQIWIVYTYASVAKLYPDWLDGTFQALLMKGKENRIPFGEVLLQGWSHQIIMYFGILFDLLVVPLLLWKRTRVPMFIASIFFHLFNSLVFHIGIFPYMSLAFTLFFFPPETINRLFLKRKPLYVEDEIIPPKNADLLKAFLAIWFVVQLCLPVRHWFIKGNVLWTEEGHRLSWRMMLRSKSAHTVFYVVDSETNKKDRINLSNYLSPKQFKMMSKPDGIWQFSQRLKNEYNAQGKEIEIYVHSKVSVNGRPYYPFIDSEVDMAKAKWNYFGHNQWILPQPEDF